MLRFDCRYFLFMVVTFLVFSCRLQDKGQHPNIIYILADDLGYGELGCYGQQKIKTPNLDRMADQGMLFTQHYAGAPVCAPSRYMLLTGTHAGHSYIRGNYELGQFSDENEAGQMPIPHTTPTIAKMLQKAGYRTGMVGKWGLGYVNTTGSPLEQGFDYYFGYLDQKQAHNYYPTHLWENDQRFPLKNTYRLVHTPLAQELTSEDFESFKGKEYAPDKMVEKAIAFIQDSTSKKPYFLFYPSPLPHVSLQVPDSLVEPYKKDFEELPYLGTKGYASHEYPKSAYAAMITHLDYEIGKIWETVKAQGQEDHTLIFFSSDNGPTFAGGVEAEFFKSTAGLRGLKMDLYEGGIRVPFIAYWKNTINGGQRSNLISGHWDIYNTIAELVGQDNEAIDNDGISLLPTLLGTSNPVDREYIYFEYPEKQGQVALRMNDWKAIKVNMKKNASASWELYNLKLDPHEKNNLARQHPEILKRADSLVRVSHRHPHLREWEFMDPKF
ncbi:MAG: arylsulfatase [Flavobacteriaceae bacterium]